MPKVRGEVSAEVEFGLKRECSMMLKGRKQAFVEALTSDPKRIGSVAAIKAGYSEKGARQAACRLLKDEKIQAAIKEIDDERHRQNTAEEREIIEFLTSVMRGEEVETLPLRLASGAERFQDGKPSARDKLKAAELLGKYYAIWTDKPNAETEGGVIILPEVENENSLETATEAG